MCRQAHPCPGLHFGVVGSGAGENIGSVLGVQRAGVILKILSVTCFLPFVVLVVGLSVGVAYPGCLVAVLLFSLAALCQFLVSPCCHTGTLCEHWSDFLERVGEPLVTVFTIPFYAAFYGIAACLCLVVAILAIPILMLLGALAFLPALLYLMTGQSAHLGLTFGVPWVAG